MKRPITQFERSQWPRRAAGLLLAAAVVSAGLGCWPKHRMGYRPPEAETEAERNFEGVWQAARKVLRDHDFELYRQDRRAGVMTTNAVVGQHFFEVWRKDAATLYNYGENSVQTIFRAVKVSITPVEGSDKFDFTVQVAIARGDQPRAAELTDASQAMTVHGGVDTSRREGGSPSINARLKYEDLLAPRSSIDAADMPVVPLGFDRRLGQILEHEIRAAAIGYAYATPRPVQYTDPGELIPAAPERAAEPALPNPALPPVAPPMPNPGGDPSDEPALLESIPDAFEHPPVP